MSLKDALAFVGTLAQLVILLAGTAAVVGFALGFAWACGSTLFAIGLGALS